MRVGVLICVGGCGYEIGMVVRMWKVWMGLCHGCVV